MKSQDAQQLHKREKQPYEPPQATCVQVQFQERILGCLYSSIKVCGLTEP